MTWYIMLDPQNAMRTIGKTGRGFQGHVAKHAGKDSKSNVRLHSRDKTISNI